MKVTTAEQLVDYIFIDALTKEPYARLVLSREGDIRERFKQIPTTYELNGEDEDRDIWRYQNDVLAAIDDKGGE